MFSIPGHESTIHSDIILYTRTLNTILYTRTLNTDQQTETVVRRHALSVMFNVIGYARV